MAVDYKGLEETLKDTKESTTKERDFYACLENINPNSLPKHIQIMELMQNKGIDESNPMYDELMRTIQDEINFLKEKRKKMGWTHTKYRVPLTREEFIVELFLHVEGEIPKEYDDVKEKMKYNR